MRLSYRHLAALVLLSIGAPAIRAASSPAPSVDEIVAKNIEARGGAAMIQVREWLSRVTRPPAKTSSTANSS